MKLAPKLQSAFFVAIALLAVPAGQASAGLLNPATKQKIIDETQALAGEGFNSAQDPSAIIANFIKGFLGLLGIIFLVLIIYAGFTWMTAGGEEEKVRKAKETIKRAVIGLIIIAASYAITYFVFKNAPGGTGTAGPLTGTPP